MDEFNLAEAQLFRILTSFFGPDRVVPRMSVLAICGGSLPEKFVATLSLWARENTCLFTVVNDDDTPKLVFEFFHGFVESIEVEQLEHQQHLPDLFAVHGIQYIPISPDEFRDLTSPGGISFFHFLQAKVALDDMDFA